jgi:phosphate transport system permease protein
VTDLALRASASAITRPRTPGERIDAPRRLTLLAAGLVVVLVALLLAFIAWNGVELFSHSGVPIPQVLSGTWRPDPTSEGGSSYGLLPFILGTLAVMSLAAIIATPLSVGLALFMAEVAPRWARSITQPAMEVFVGIPSVVYGWLGLTVLVPAIREHLGGLGFTLGFSWFAGGLVLSIMILPTITSVALDAFTSVPAEQRRASLALGTTRWQTIRHMLIPSAVGGVATGVVLGMMRAAGEALAVQMVIGNRPVIPTGITDPLTTLTSQITLDMGNTVAGEPWNEALWTMGLVLLLISFGFVALVRRLASARAERAG